MNPGALCSLFDAQPTNTGISVKVVPRPIGAFGDAI